MRCLSRTLLDDGRDSWELRGHRAHAPSLEQMDQRPLPTEQSLEREIDELLWSLDLEDALELCERDVNLDHEGDVP